MTLLVPRDYLLVDTTKRVRGDRVLGEEVLVAVQLVQRAGEKKKVRRL